MGKRREEEEDLQEYEAGGAGGAGGARDDKPVDIERWIDQDLSAALREGRLSPAFEVDDTVRQVEEMLSITPARSPVLVGKAGIGKTVIIHEVVRRALAGQGAAVLRDRRVVQLSLRNISTQFKDREQAGEFAHRLFDALAAAGVIVYIRDVHIAYRMDWEAILYRFLVQSGLPLLGEGALQDLEQMLDFSSDLAETLLLIPVTEPKGTELQRIVARWSETQAGRSHRAVNAEAQHIAIELTGRFLGDKPYPRKVLELLSQTRDLLPARDDPSPNAAPLVVTPKDVVARFSASTRVPSRLVDPEEPLDLAAMGRFLEERLLGQAESVEAVMRMVAIIKAGLTDSNRPFGVFLFVGPTGVGKTHTAQLLAEYLFGDRQRMVRVNLTDFADDNGLNNLMGDPNGYPPDNKVGALAKRLRGHPFGVLLLDEFEKATSKVHNALMQLFDEGQFTNGAGDTISARSLIIIATSNTGAEVFREKGIGFQGVPDLAALDAELDRRLHRSFAFELLNRFDRIVHFHPLDRAHIRAIAQRELAGLLQREGIRHRGHKVEFEPEVVEWLAAHGYHPLYGARFLRRVIERDVAGAVAEAIVRSQRSSGARLQVTIRADRVQVRVLPQAEPKATLRVGERPRHLDQEELQAAAREQAQRWEPLHEAAAARVSQAAALIEQSHAPTFWDDAEAAQALLQRYASLDARIQTDARLAEPALRLGALVDRGAWPPLEELARLIEESAAAGRRAAEVGDGLSIPAAWLYLSSGDPLSPAGDWLADLVGLYTAWLPRQGLRVSVAAEEEQNGQLLSAVLEVEGPGVLRILEMERGLHRRRVNDGEVERARVEVFPARGGAGAHRAEVEDARHVRGRLLAQRRCRLRIDLPARGLSHVLYGADRPTLSRLSVDLQAGLAEPAELELARTYGIVGGTVRDPRTDAVVPAVKEALRGHLEPLLRAWERRQG